MNEPKLKIILGIGILVILGIAGSYIITAILFSSNDHPPGNTIPGEDRLPQAHKEIDTHFAVEEWNLSFVHNKTIVHVTYEELKVFPDLEKAMHGVNNDPSAWSYGQRLVNWFDGNESDLYRFYTVACKGKTRAECYPNPPIFEYHGQYYSIFSDVYRSHSPL